MRRRQRFVHWKKLLAVTIGVIVLFLAAGGLFVWSMVRDVEDVVEQGSEQLQISVEREQVETIEEKRTVSVLLLGIDRRGTEQGRSDTMIVMTLNPETDEGAMLSIPRDTFMPIIGRDKEDKVNHAYAFGGAEMALDTVEAFLDIPIDYVVEADLDGFIEVVDTVGGVTVMNKFAFESNGYTFPVGEVELGGDAALAFVQMRYDDPDGDFGRQERQRAVVAGIVQKSRDDFSMDTMSQLLDVVGQHTKTNLELHELMTLSTEYMDAFYNASTLRLEGTGGLASDDIYYWYAEESSLSAIKEELKRLLE